MELLRLDCAYFINHFCKIKDDRNWIPFSLWPAQSQALKGIQEHKQVVILKARQLGFTWLVLAMALHTMRFTPGATILLFSLRDDEAVETLDRLKKIYDHLPDWLKLPRQRGLQDNDHEWELSNGSRALAFPTTAGRSYTATLAIVDEADIIPDLEMCLDNVKATVDAGGKLVLLSTSDKTKQESLFKSIYRNAKQGLNSYHPIFIPWHGRPERTQEWYEEQKKDILANTGSLDFLHQIYPATDVEALAPKTLDKRIPPEWLQQCYEEKQAISIPTSHFPKPPAIPGLTIYALPFPGKKYVAGADPAEGNPTSDESSATWLDMNTGEEVATLSGKFQPSTFADYIHKVNMWFNRAKVLVERNNHGHTVILALSQLSSDCLLGGFLDKKVGWLTTGKAKAMMYTTAADMFRDQETLIHSFGTLVQLQSIDGNTLSAPEGLMDDRATGYVLACQAMRMQERSKNAGIPFVY